MPGAGDGSGRCLPGEGLPGLQRASGGGARNGAEVRSRGAAGRLLGGALTRRRRGGGSLLVR